MERRSFANTSSGIAHVYIHPQPLNTNSCHVCQDAPLPPQLRRRGLGHHYHSVTSYMEHHSKPKVARVPSDVIYSKAPPHWGTHLVNNLAQKMRDTRSLRLASVPAHSEMQDQYRGRLEPCDPLEPHYRPLKALHRRLYQSSALLPEEPALSTAQADYRHFSRSELAPFLARGPFTQNATTLRRLPAHQAPPRASSQLHLQRLPLQLPHGSRSSVYMDSFRVPAPPQMSFTPYMAVPAGTKYTEESGRSLLQHILDVPEMYGTENQTYGRGMTVLV